MSKGIPTARNVDHLGVTVPDLEQAVDFFTRVLGCDLLWRGGPYEDDGTWMAEHLGVHPRAELKLAMVRFGPNLNLELLEYRAPEARSEPPRNSDHSAAHLCFYVGDLDAALAYLAEQPGVSVMGSQTTVTEGAAAGLRYVYFTAPWGLQLELVHWPEGMPYESTTAARLYGPTAVWEETT